MHYLRGVSTKLNKYIVFTMQTYKKLKYKAVPFRMYDPWYKTNGETDFVWVSVELFLDFCLPLVFPDRE